MVKRLSAWVRGILVVLLIGTINGHGQEVAPSQLDEAARRAVVRSAAEELRQRYVFPDVGNRAAETLETALSAGRYDGAQDPEEFARRLTLDLAGVTHDKHVRVTTAGSPPLSCPGVAPSAPPRNEWGIARADRLDDNIGYVEIVSLPELALFEPALDRAMAALAKTRALIIDARRNGGGGPWSEAYLASYFLKAKERVAVNQFITRTPGTETFTAQKFWSSATPFSYAGKPVYVLTSCFTFSGGEALAYDLHALGLAVIVGEQTAGGANPGGVWSLGFGLSIFVPGGRGENPKTHTNWESVGVTPDVRTPASDALKVALQKLGLAPSQAQISDLSKARLFEPRTTQQPGSEGALRRLADGLARGEPPYDLMSEGRAQFTREWLVKTQGEWFKELGPIQSITFSLVDDQGADRFEATHRNGSHLLWGIALDKDGKIASFGMMRAPPAP
jgi:hypothetical protein